MGSDQRRSKYEQIAADLRAEILSGRYGTDGKLPSEADLAARYGVARTTARRALVAMQRERLAVGRAGSGVFVQDHRRLERRPRRYRRQATLAPFASEATAAGRAPRIEADSQRTAAPADIAERLQLGSGDPVMRTAYRFLADGQAVQLSTSWEPLDITGGTEVEIPEEGPAAGVGVVARLDRIGVRIVTVVEEVAMRPPTRDETATLGLRPGEYVFAIARTFATADRPVETADIVMPGDRYALVYQFGIPDSDQDPVTS
jgi:GntR family transcriptional regulator